MSGKLKKMKGIVTIAERGCGNMIARLYEQNSIHYHYQCSGHGTASSELLDVLGIGTKERDVVISIGTEDRVDDLMDAVDEELRHQIPSHGLVFTLAVEGINNMVAASLSYLDGEASGKGEMKMEQEQKENSHRHSLILVTVNQGHTDTVMNTAKEAGARGGTIIRARWNGSEEAEQFYGITLQGEKEIIAILASHENRNAIMEKINENHGMKTEAGAVICALPVEQVLRLA